MAVNVFFFFFWLFGQKSLSNIFSFVIVVVCPCCHTIRMIIEVLVILAVNGPYVTIFIIWVNCPFKNHCHRTCVRNILPYVCHPGLHVLNILERTFFSPWFGCQWSQNVVSLSISIVLSRFLFFLFLFSFLLFLSLCRLCCRTYLLTVLYFQSQWQNFLGSNLLKGGGQCTTLEFIWAKVLKSFSCVVINKRAHLL